MGQLSLKKLVELTGYADSKFVSVSDDSYAIGVKKENPAAVKSSDESKTKDVFSHRRALRVV